jgi:hypothetical protein
LSTSHRRRAKAPTLKQTFVTPGALDMRDWHKHLRRWTMWCAAAFVFASYFSLRWACLLVGLPSPFEGGLHLAVPFAEGVPLAIEVGMLSIASTATTIRKRAYVNKAGKQVRGAYYKSLWVIFSFLMVLSQAANIGHAMVAITEQLPTMALPQFIAPTAVYVFGACFAALFPLGGTLLVHVSGFLREHGTGAQWIEADTAVVYEEVEPGAVQEARPRSDAPPPAPDKAVERERAAPDLAPMVHASNNGALSGLAATEGALKWYAGEVRASRRPTQGAISAWFAERGLECSPQNASKVRRAWDHALGRVELTVADPERDPIADQVDAETKGSRIRVAG